MVKPKNGPKLTPFGQSMANFGGMTKKFHFNFFGSLNWIVGKNFNSLPPIVPEINFPTRWQHCWDREFPLNRSGKSDLLQTNVKMLEKKSDNWWDSTRYSYFSIIACTIQLNNTQQKRLGPSKHGPGWGGKDTIRWRGLEEGREQQAGEVMTREGGED